MTQTTNEPPVTAAIVHAIFAGPVRTLRSPREPGSDSSTWKSAILKSAMTTPVFVGALGLDGDAQKDTRHHGGPTKAVLVYGARRYATLWDDTLQRHAVAYADALRDMSAEVDASVYGFGAFGENLTVSDLDEHRVFLGDRWQVGSCVLQVTEPRGPCTTLTRRWMRPALLDEVKQTAAAGWYNAVHTPGRIAAGDSMRLVERVQNDWSVARVFDLLEQRVAARADLVALHDATCTHDTLRARLSQRLLTASRIRD